MKYDEYRRQAAFCHSRAAEAETEMMERIWRRLAAYWLSLIPQVPPVESRGDLLPQDMHET